MFSGCSSLTDLDVSNLNTSEVTNMGFMFARCYSLPDLDVSNFNTSKVTDMSFMFTGCIRLSSLNVSRFDTSNVTNMNDMFYDCSGLHNLDLSNFDASSATDISTIIYGCNGLININTPCNVFSASQLPQVLDAVWYLPDGTEVTELPQGLSYSVLLTRGYIEGYFQVTEAAGYSRYTDVYVAQNTAQTVLDTLFDDFYENTYQTLFLNDINADLLNLAPVYEVGRNTVMQVNGQEQASGISIQDFSQGAVSYTAYVQGTQDAEKNYRVSFAKKETGGKLFVNGPAEREIYLTDYFGNVHDILVANVGDQELTGLKAELIGAVNVKLDEANPLSGALPAFTHVPASESEADTAMENFGKVRLVPDGEGEISGILRITADGQEPVDILLTGYSDNPKIITTTPDLNMEDVVRVKYVPYSYTVLTDNECPWNKVTFSLESGTLAEGLQIYPETGEIYGMPLEAGEFPIVVKATYSRPEFLPSCAQLTLIVKENTYVNVAAATDSGYEIIQPVQNLLLDSMVGSANQLFVSRGEYAEFLDVYLDGDKLTAGSEYDSESGSTRITILNQTLARGGAGTHALSVEFRTMDTKVLKRAAQNYIVSGTAGSGNGSDGSDNGGNTGDTGDTGNNGNAGNNSPGGGNTENNGNNSQGSNAGSSGGSGNNGAGSSSGIGGSGADNAGGNADSNGAENDGLQPEDGGQDEETMTTVIHTVQRGDTLWGIAEKYLGSGRRWREIYEANTDSIRNPNVIYPGQQIKIYVPTGNEDGRDAQTGNEDSEGGNAGAGSESTLYTVQPGDSLWEISRKVYGDGRFWRRIYQNNKDKIRNVERIYRGQVFVIPK